MAMAMARLLPVFEHYNRCWHCCRRRRERQPQHQQRAGYSRMVLQLVWYVLPILVCCTVMRIPTTISSFVVSSRTTTRILPLSISISMPSPVRREGTGTGSVSCLFASSSPSGDNNTNDDEQKREQKRQQISSSLRNEINYDNDDENGRRSQEWFFPLPNTTLLENTTNDDDNAAEAPSNAVVSDFITLPSEEESIIVTGSEISITEVDVLDNADNTNDITTTTTMNDRTNVTRMLILLFLVGSLCSLDRVAMSVTLVPIAQEIPSITDTVKGQISSFFSIGYGVGILPAGLFLASPTTSPKLVLAGGIVLWSLGTLITPYSVSTGNMSLLLSARTLVGLSESAVIPAIQRLLVNWIPSQANKGMAVAIVLGGFQFGTIVAYALTPQIMEASSNGWRSVFYLYGSAGFLFVIPWLVLAHDAPPVTTITAAAAVPKKIPTTTTNTKSNDTSNDEITVDNMNGMMQTSNNTMSNTAQAVIREAPWSAFLASRGVWAMFLAHAANNWGLYNNLSWTPTFYQEQYGLNVKESALLLVVPSIVGGLCGLGSGKVADSLIQKQLIAQQQQQQDPDYASDTDGSLDTDTDTDTNSIVEYITRVRKIFQGIGLLGPTLCMTLLAAHIPEEPSVAQLLFAVAVGLQSFNAAGYGAANQEKAGPQYTGLLYSITSLPAVVVGTTGVYLTGKILDATHQNWSYVFGLNSVKYAIGGLAFIILYDAQKEFD